MTVTLNASQVPSPLAPSTITRLSDAENSMGLNGAKTMRTIAQGDTILSTKFNRNMMAVELLGRYGAGCYAVLNGLELQDSGGLAVIITEGQALIDGIVETTEYSYPVIDNQSRIYLWLKQDGTFTHALDTTPPAEGKVFIGSCSTSGGAITSLDKSGVVYAKGGLFVRQTADIALPTDTPSGNVSFWTLTPSGMYLWNGSAYNIAYTSTQLLEAVQDIVGNMVADSTGVAWTYNDTTGTISITFNLTAFTTSSLPEGTNLYFTPARVEGYLTSNHVPYSVNEETLSATKTLSLTDKNLQILQASGGSRDVRLPASVNWGNWFKIHNVGTSNNIVVKSNDGATTIVTLTPGQLAWIYPVTNSGSPAWPSTITPENG